MSTIYVRARKKLTASEAAAQTRAEIKHHLKVLQRGHDPASMYSIALDHAREFIDSMAERADKRPGGLGKKIVEKGRTK